MPEAPINDLQPELDRKTAALEERIALIQAQEAAELARFGPAPEPAPEPKKSKKSEEVA